MLCWFGGTRPSQLLDDDNDVRVCLVEQKPAVDTAGGAANGDSDSDDEKTPDAPEAEDLHDHLRSQKSIKGILDRSPVLIVVRIRPLNARETGLGATTCLTIKNKQCVGVEATSEMIASGAKKNKDFVFDAILPDDTTQEAAYTRTAKPLLAKLLDGYNCTCFCYGQTGSGKTYTMLGDVTSIGTSFSSLPVDSDGDDDGGPVLSGGGGITFDGGSNGAGLIPRFVTEMFAPFAGEQAVKTVTVVASYVEIYNNELRDLLSPENFRAGSAKLDGDDDAAFGAAHQRGKNRRVSAATVGRPRIREDPAPPEQGGRGVYLENVVMEQVENAADVLRLLKIGTRSRVVAKTDMNAVSSRSHAVLTLRVAQRDRGDDAGFTELRSKVHLVDLAGSPSRFFAE